MIGFCGAIDLCGGEVSFSDMRRMCGAHTKGCAFINGCYGILCDGGLKGRRIQPVTKSDKGYLYTSAVICETPDGDDGTVAEALLEGYMEEGEGYIHRLDFPYAVALYDGRRGELLLAKGHLGDMPLFVFQRESTLYFATSLMALFRLLGGKVRVDRRVLISHLTGAVEAMPAALFPDISYVGAGQGILCSRLGVSRLVGTQRVYAYESGRAVIGETLPKAPKGQIREHLKESLFAFGYPQFDCYMPALTSYLKSKMGARRVRVYDPTLFTCRAYSVERAQRIGGAVGVRVTSSDRAAGRVSRVGLRSMEREIDAVLSQYLEDNKGILRTLGACVNAARKEKDVVERIRKKGMLAQCAMWFEIYDMSLV